MKYRLLSALLISSLTIPVFAYQGKNYRIINEQVTHSANFNGGFETRTPKTLYVNAMAWSYNASGHTYEYIKVQGDHNISLSNSTKMTQRYTYQYSLSCEDAYENFERTIELFPGGTFTDNSHSFGTVQKESSGTFGIHVLTSVSGAENRTHTSDAVLRVN